jgi:RNA polymerase sigma-54 factor
MKNMMELRLGQRLAMTPQLQQAIQLLQLSSLELEQEIQKLLETNPMLETEDDPHVLADQQAQDTLAAEALDAPLEPIAMENRASNSEFDPWDESGGLGHRSSESEWSLEQTLAMPEADLRAHLLEQLDFLKLDPAVHRTATTLVAAIDDDGYLREDPLESCRGITAMDPDPALVAQALAVVHSLEPAGVGAANLPEALVLQLVRLDADSHLIDLAIRAVSHHLELVGRRRTAALRKELGCTEETVNEVLALIETLQPRPASSLATSSAPYAIPDVFVHRDSRGHWQVELNGEVLPRVRVNRYYERLLQEPGMARCETMRHQLQEARWFLKSLRSRNETLLRVAQCIVQHQQAFFEHGQEAMRPLVLRDVAAEVDMHESTISRVTYRKYLQCSRGLYEFKYFFSTLVGAGTDDCSSTAVQARIRQLIEKEDPHKPLSDSDISKALAALGIDVARRTVAKYREEHLRLPPSSERRQAANRRRRLGHPKVDRDPA